MADSDPLVPPGHFYSPMVDPLDRHVQAAMAEEAVPRASVADFGLNAQRMEWFFLSLCAEAASREDFPALKTEGWRYYYENTTFPLMDALALLTVMATGTAHRYVEIGCGFSSAAAADINERCLGSHAKMTLIDPNPRRFLDLPGMGMKAEIIESPVQDVPTDVFRELECGDILFIDSSHVAKTGSDVLDCFFRILPALRPGVLIHFHDIFYPFEYPASWIIKHNRSWNEAYFLRAFLANNPDYRVLFMSDWIYKCRRAWMEQHLPECIDHRGGSLWMEKT